METSSPHCPRCGYDLSGHASAWRDSCPTAGTCSECGHSFHWGELFFPLRHAPSWSFEHSTRPTVALVLSWWRSLRPRSFWSRLQMHHPIVPARLWVALAATLLLMHLATGVGMAWLEHTAGDIAVQTNSDWLRVRDVLSVFINPYARVVANQFPPVYSAWVYIGVLTALLCPSGFVMLRQTFTTLGLRRDHVLRAAAYSLAPLPLLLLVFSLARAISAYGSAWALGMTLRTTPSGPPDGLTRFCNSLDDAANWIGTYQWLAMPLALAWSGSFWWCFARHYLKLPDATRATALLVLVAFLAALAVVMFWPGSSLAGDLGALLTALRP
ncbi:MAG: hypothetical protein IT432_09855 [Phycisphaerales bacterium]|nr:hypothetical protein [Phycisphaerales bacterium]